MKLNTKRTLLVGLAFFTIQAIWQMYNTEVPLMLEKMLSDTEATIFHAAKTTVINFIMTIDNILALFMLPLFGVLSDKTHTRIGKRMPYILVGTAFSVTFLILMPIFYAIDSFIGFFLMLGGLLLAMSVYRSPAVALMPDVTPKPLRSKANALINLMGAAGMILILVATMVIGKIADGKLFYIVLFTFCGVMVVAAITAMYFSIDENQLLSEMPDDEPETEEERMHREGKGIHIHATVKTSLVFLLIAVAMWYMAYGCIETNFSRYAVNNLGMNESTKAIPMLVATGASLIGFVPLGVLSSKIGRKKMVMIGVGVLTLAALVGSFATNLIVLYILFAFIGVSWAAINVNSYPMVVEMAKGADIGRYTGYYYTFQTAAQIATPLFSGLLIDVFESVFKSAFNQDGLGMKVLFPYSVVFLVLALIAMLFVKHGDSKETDIQKLKETTN